MSPTKRASLQMQVCVLLWGFTAILGKAIMLPALPLVFWRMLLVTGILACWPPVWRALRLLPVRLVLGYMGIGAVLSLHWLTFYLSIKLSNASVAATTMALGAVFVAVVEPFIAGKRFEARELILGVAVIPGVLLVAGGLPRGLLAGAAVGVLSAFLVAIFGSLQKRLVMKAPATTVTFIELGAGALVLSALAPLLPHALLLGVLAVGCTLIPFTLSVVALRHLTAFAAQLAINLEPIYTILIAAVLLGEHKQLSLSFYAGAALIVAVVFVQPWVESRRARRSKASD